ncbi:MAG TPA: Crp/Fnr family transcriptional regulator [Steroidobacteraceae bacterium]|nr:Crp/Fnr family transcriptional regulator [Steroidobacteraceae bacterium]
MTDLMLDIQRHPFVEGMRPEHVAQLGRLARRAEFPANDILFPEGDLRHEFFLLIAGRVALEIVSHGQAVRVDTLEPGAALGWSSVLLNRGKFFQARALEPVKALVFPGGELLDECREHTDFGFELMRRLLEVVSRRLQVARVKVLDSYWPVAKRAGA